MTSEQNVDPIFLDHLIQSSDDLETYLNVIFNNMEEAIFVKDEECRILLVNDAFCTIFKLPRNEILGKTLAEKVPPDEREHFLSVDRQVLKDGKEISCEETLTTAGTPTKTIMTRKSRFVDSKGNYFLVGVIHDITKNKEAEKKLRRAASVFTHALEGILITDASATIIEVNDSFSVISGYTRDETLGKSLYYFRSERHPPEFYAEMWNALLAKGNWKGEVWSRHKNGAAYAVLLTISAMQNESGQLQNYVGLFSDITAQKNLQRQLEHIASHDVLTGLPNRTLLADRLTQAIALCQRRNQSLAVAFVDLDGFKSVNDMHGHSVGDKLLVKVSRRMEEVLRDGDTLARIGGDEFIAILVDLENIEDSQPALERLIEVTSAPITVDDIVLNISVSIGVAFCPQDGSTPDQLIRHADKAMYIAKREKNRFCLFDNS